jgi:hypothetical protein
VTRVATLLTTKKMRPELRERIESQVLGRKKPPGRALPPLAMAMMRFTILAVAIGAVVVFVLARKQGQQEIADARTTLLERLRVETAALTEEDLRTPARVESWLLRLSGPYEGDFVAESLRAPGAFDRLVKRPSIYVRGEVLGFSNPAATRASAAESRKDPFLLCLVDPPASRTEKSQLKKVHAAYSGGDRIENPTAHVRRLEEAQRGIALLSPAWRDQVEAADKLDEVQRLRRVFESTPIGAAHRAAKARVLIAVMDEPGDKGPIELDGERPHPARVTIVDLASERVVLRLRRDVDPKWISAARRPDYARGLDGCALALDVRDAVKSDSTESQ